MRHAMPRYARVSRGLCHAADFLLMRVVSTFIRRHGSASVYADDFHAFAAARYAMRCLYAPPIATLPLPHASLSAAPDV